MPGAGKNKGWYRYKLEFGAARQGAVYEANIFLNKRPGSDGETCFSREEAEIILRNIGHYIKSKADFKNLTEDF